MNKIKLSIVTPAYNVENFIGDLYKSLKNNLKAFSNIEWIIINDGSTDNTLEIIKSYKEPWIKLFTKKNEGLGSARTLGLQKAKGEYVWHIDADDFPTDDAFEVLLPTLKDSTYDLIRIGDYHFDDVTKNKTPSKLMTLKSLMKSPNVWPQAIIVKKSIIPNNFSFFPKNGDTAYMYVFDILDWKKCLVLQERIVCYRVNINGSMSTSKSVDIDLRSSKYWYKLYEDLKNKNYKKKALRASYLDFSYALFIAKSKNQKIKTPSYVKKMPIRFKTIILLVRLTPKFIAKIALK